MRKRILYLAAAGTIVSMLFAACGNKKIDETAFKETSLTVETEMTGEAPSEESTKASGWAG